jgi:hypothetical protein
MPGRAAGTLPDGCHLPSDTPPSSRIRTPGRRRSAWLILGGTFGGSAFGSLAGHFIFTDINTNVVFRARPARGA